MIPGWVTISGYSIPFGKVRAIGDARLEMIDAGAFDQWLNRRAAVPVVWDSHGAEAPVLASDVSVLFADDVGLGFSASVYMRARGGVGSSYLAAMVRPRNPFDQCSVSFSIVDEDMVNVAGQRVHRVTKASVRHIAITDAAAYGAATGVWVDHLIDDLDAPYRLRVMAAQWRAGREDAKLKRARSNLLAWGYAVARGPGRGRGGDLSGEQVARVNAIVAKVEAIDRRRGVLGSLPGGKRGPR